MLCCSFVSLVHLFVFVWVACLPLLVSVGLADCLSESTCVFLCPFVCVWQLVSICACPLASIRLRLCLWPVSLSARLCACALLRLLFDRVVALDVALNTCHFSEEMVQSSKAAQFLQQMLHQRLGKISCAIVAMVARILKKHS